MIEPIRDWLHRKEPTALAFRSIVGVSLIAWIATLLFIAVVSGYFGLWVSFSDLFDEAMPRFHLAFLGLVVVAAGIYRAIACHALADRKYGAWLAQTPWRYPQLLPFGPIQLAWQDGVVMLSAVVMACLPPTQWRFVLILPCLYPVAYVVTLCAVHWIAGVRWPALLAVALLGGVILTQSTIAIAVSILVLVVASWWTIGAVLHDFPYNEARRLKLGLSPAAPRAAVQVHWPVAPEPIHRWYQRIGSGEALVVAALVGWMIFAMAAANRDEPDNISALRVWYWLIALLAISCRMGFYLVEHLPPLSLLGRWKWKQWVIPGYDVVFIAPIVATVTAYALPGLLIRSGVSDLAAQPIAITATIWLAAALPPKWENWHYAGHHRCSLGGVINSKTEVQS